MTNLVHIGGMTFNIAAQPLADQLVCEALDGWFGSPSMRADTSDRSNSDGAFGSVKNYRSARVITFRGSLLGDNPTQAQAELWDTFAAIQSDGQPFTFSVENDIGIRSCTVSLSGEASIEVLSDFRTAEVTAQFIAYDPVKYGPAVDYNTGLATGGGGLEYNLFDGGAGGALYYGANGNLGRVEVTNSGTADVSPVFLITGELTNGFYIQCLETGQVLRYDRVVPAGSTVTLDARTGEVLVDGVSDASTYLTIDQWFRIPAGGSCTIQFNAISGSSGTPTMTVTSSDGFW